MDANEYVARSVAIEEARIKIDALARIVMALPGAKDTDWEALIHDLKAGLKPPISANFGQDWQLDTVEKIVSDLKAL